jgi:hypothetical protein
MAQILHPSGFQPLSCQQLSVMEVSFFHLALTRIRTATVIITKKATKTAGPKRIRAAAYPPIDVNASEPSTVNQFAIAAAHSQSDNVDFEFSENATSCLLTTSCIQSCNKVDSILAQQHHRIDRQCALSWDPCGQ